jgi:hypothetical protein
MRRSLFGFVIALFLALPAAGFCGGDLDVFISNLNAEARVDLGAFKARVSTTYGVPMAHVEAVFGSVQTPADAYMVFRVRELSGRPEAAVLDEYRADKGKGWGAMAKDLGIKPGSPEFHALKKGWDDAGGPGNGKGNGNGKGGKKDKGNGKGNGKKK